MPLKDAAVGDVVQYRDAKGRTRNAIVTGTQPAAPGTGAWSVANVATGGVLGVATYTYRITAVRGGAESAPATGKTNVVASGTTNRSVITLPGVAGETYNVYGRTGGTEQLIATGQTTSFSDTGSVTPSGALPTADGRVGLSNPTGGLSLGKTGGTATKATGLKQTNRYYKR